MTPQVGTIIEATTEGLLSSTHYSNSGRNKSIIISMWEKALSDSLLKQIMVIMVSHIFNSNETFLAYYQISSNNPLLSKQRN